MASEFSVRGTKADVEEGAALAPKFDALGLLTAVATDHATGVVLMVAFMNAEALRLTIETGKAVYFSRSRNKLWHKGEESGHVQKVRELRIDCDQDCVWLKVEQAGGAACHVGYQTCFYRAVSVGKPLDPATALTLAEAGKTYDPATVYGQGGDPRKPKATTA